MRARIRGFLGSLMPAGLVGAFFLLVVGRLMEPGQANRVALFAFGWLYGVGVLALIRLFRVTPGVFPLVGLVCGPVPVALIANAGMQRGDLGGLGVLTALLGVVVGTIEWARVRRGDAVGSTGSEQAEWGRAPNAEGAADRPGVENPGSGSHDQAPSA